MNFFDQNSAPAISGNLANYAFRLSMMYITVYNLSINSNNHILATELNYRFTLQNSEDKLIMWYMTSQCWKDYRAL